MKKASINLILIAAVVTFMASCSSPSAPAPKDNHYTISGKVPDRVDAEWMYLYNIDRENQVAFDSAKIINGEFCLEGTAPDTVLLAVLHPGALDDYPAVGWNVIVEPGYIVADDADAFASGTPLNDGLRSWMLQIARLFKEGNQDEKAILTAFFKEHWNEHSSDFVGAFVLVDAWMYMDFNYVDSLVSQIPEDIRNIQLIRQNLIEPVASTRASQPGNSFKDIALVTLDGAEIHLSDYVGKGDYVLVDFWASWCGPCRESIPELQAAIQKHPKVKVLGVAIRDDANDTRQAIKNLKITWPVVSDPTIKSGEIYGFSAIPFMMLFGPDGKIIARNIFAEELDRTLTEKVK